MAKDDQDSDLFSLGNDVLKMKILDTHAPGVEELDVKPVLSLVEDIMSFAKPLSADISNLGAHQIPSHDLDTSDDKVLDASDQHDDVIHRTAVPVGEIVKMLEYPINYTSYVMTWESVGAVDPHSLTMELLKSLSIYSWDAKLVITYAAFAINYGEFWLLQDPKNQLADSIATLMGFPDVKGLGSQLEMELQAVLDVLTEVLKVTHCIMEFKEIPPLYISRQSPDIPIAVYWIIRSLLVCTSTITNLFGDYDEYISKTSAAAKRTLSNYARNLSAILQSLQNQLKICKDLVEDDNIYNVIKNSTKSAYIDNIKILSTLIHSREDQSPLYDGAKRTKEGLEVLRQKHVLLLISELEFRPEELRVLHKIHNDHSMRHVYEYEVLWLPIVNPTTSMATELQESQFYSLRNIMPWYSVEHPSSVHRVTIRFIREDLRFERKPRLVVLDPYGKLSVHDALPMMWIWGAKAFPFTQDKERELWATSDWNIDLIADGIDPRIPGWINDNKVICLYGGDDVDWIHKFTESARTAARALKVPLEMLYVGKSTANINRVRRCHEKITQENLSHIFAVENYYDCVWYFWTRFSSMWNSRNLQIGRTVEDDHILRGILEVLSYDSSEQGWAVFSRGNYEITKAKGEMLLHTLDQYTQWGHEVDHPHKFVNVLDKYLRDFQFHPPEYCNRLILPGIGANIPEMVVCAECGKPMEKFITYRCCTD